MERNDRLWLTARGWQKLCRLVDERDGRRCRICGSTWRLHHHHVVFRSHCHIDKEDNVILLCWRCHDIYAHGKKEKAYRIEFEDYLKSPEIRAWRADHKKALESIYKMTRKGK